MEAQTDHEKYDRYLHGYDRGIETGAFLDADYQNCGDYQGNDEGWKVDADFYSEYMRCVQQIVCTLQQFRWLGGGNRSHLIQEGLRTRHQARIGHLRHLSCNHAFRG